MTDAEHYPPCAFVSLVLGRMTAYNDMEFEDIAKHTHIGAARAMRGQPSWTDVESLPGIGVRARGVRYAWCAQDDCYGYERADSMYGTIEAR